MGGGRGRGEGANVRYEIIYLKNVFVTATLCLSLLLCTLCNNAIFLNQYIYGLTFYTTRFQEDKGKILMYL